MDTTKKTVRVRFAPSPTGPLHIGGVRTALYNFLFARKHNGKFILRIEDTDQKRFVPGAEKYITQALGWCGLTADEGPSIGGEYGPYRQSERKTMYSSFVQQLLDSGHAYYAFDTPQELEEMRNNMRASGVQSPTYNNITRSSMKNSLTLPSEEVNARLNSGDNHVVRIKMPRNEEIKFEDKIRGWVSVNSNHVDDKVIYKSDGMPTYHLANVVDDYSMKITHVIRGEEWLPSAPLHVYLYKCFGWEKNMPIFAHLPLILKPDGNGKLSKRDGDRLGFPVFPIDWVSAETNETFQGYREQGFLPEAFINMLAFLGWNPGTDQEVFALPELISAFSLGRVGKSGAKYDFSKTKWFNQQHLRLKSNQDLFEAIIHLNDGLVEDFSKDYIMRVIELVKERATFYEDLVFEGKAFFEHNIEFNKKAVTKKWKEKWIPNLREFCQDLASLESFTHDEIENAFHQYLNKTEMSIGQLMPMLRIAITGSLAGPSMFCSIELLGKEKIMERINVAINKIKDGKDYS